MPKPKPLRSDESGAPTLNVVALENGTVAVQFSADVREFVFTRPQAIELGVGLITMAARAELVTTHPVLGIVKGRSN